MIREASGCHFELDIAAQAKLQTDFAFNNDLLDVVWNMNNMTNPIRRERKQDTELEVSRRLWRFRKMDGDTEAVVLCLWKSVAEDLDVALRRISTEINTNHAMLSVLQGEIHNLQRFFLCVSAINGQN